MDKCLGNGMIWTTFWKDWEIYKIILSKIETHFYLFPQGYIVALKDSMFSTHSQSVASLKDVSEMSCPVTFLLTHNICNAVNISTYIWSPSKENNETLAFERQFVSL